MPFNIIIGASLFVDKKVDRSILNIIKERDIVLVGNGNTLSTKSFRIQEEVIEKLEEAGAGKVIYTELTSKNMAVLKKTDIIYIMGGDILELLKLYQNVLFKELLQKHLKKGLLIAEGEAAVLLSDDITWYLENFCRIKNAKSYKGLGLVGEQYFVEYQYNKRSLDSKLQEIEKTYSIELKRLSKKDCIFTSYQE